MGSAFSSFTKGLIAIKDAIVGLGSTILNGIKEFFTALFVPDADELNSKVEEVKAYFGFMDVINDVQKEVFGAFEKTPVAPSVSINFGNAKGKYGFNKVGAVMALDFAWYTPYKPAVDVIIIAFCYAFFILNIYRRLPDIISGSGAIVVNADKINNYKGD